MNIGFKLKPQQEVILAAALGIGGVAAWYLLLYYPLHAKTVETDRLVSHQTDSLKALQHYRSEIARMERELEMLREQEAVWEARFLSRAELPSLTDRIIQLGRSLGLSLVRIRPSLQELYAMEMSGMPVSGQNLMKLPLRVHFQGRFHDLGRFLESLGELPFQVTVSDISISHNREIYPAVDIYLYLFIYVRW